MKKRHRGIITAILLILCIGPATPVFSAEGVFREVNGKVEYKNPGGSWNTAKVGERVAEGGRISTGFNSKASIEIESSILKVKSLTRMSLDELVKEEGLVSTKLHLRVGRVGAEVKSGEGLRHNFRISSPVSTASVKGTSFEFDGINLSVSAGTVRFTNSNNIGGNVSAGGKGTIPGTGSPMLGAAARLDDITVPSSTLPNFNDIEGLLVEFYSGGSLGGVEYGSIGGTVTKN